ncbi:MAG: phage holin family protein [Gammaproteobacteria bacterium]|nr:phage holin family protein [Gammaproteobacteria bacterium]
MDGEESGAPPRSATGLFQSLTRMIGTLVAMAQTRLELLTTELQEEVERAAELLLWSFVALLAAGAGIMFIGATVIIAFWDTHRVLAAILVTATFILLALISLAVVVAKFRSKPKMLAATRAELARDRAVLETRE